MSDLLSTLPPFYERIDVRQSLLAKTLITVGILWSSKQALSFLEFIRIYFLKRSSIQRYITPSSHSQSSSDNTKDETWALVTGASDGIGKGYAEELCSRGINVILHGRNETKLNRVRDDLLRRFPNRSIKLLIIDSNITESDVTSLAEALQKLTDEENLKIRILINNVGGVGTVTPIFAPLIDRSPSDISQILNINTRFTTEITRLLLPQLRANQPSLIITIGSGASDFASPYLELYAASKAYMQNFSTSLRLELQAEPETSEIEVIHYQVGMVATESSKRYESTFLMPSPRKFARVGLDRVGCGREIVWPYWVHALQFGIIGGLPVGWRNRAVLGIAREERRKFGEGEGEEEKGKK